jgi:hypothetical protein
VCVGRKRFSTDRAEMMERVSCRQERWGEREARRTRPRVGGRGAGEGRGGWGCQQREGCWVIHAVGFEREDQLREVTSQNLGVVRGREAEVFDLRVQSVARSWGFAAGTPLALVGGGLGDGFHEEGVEVEG